MEEAFGDWNTALQQQNDEQRANADAETQRYGEKIMSNFDNLVMKGKQKRAEARRMQDATLSAMMLQARQNNGFIPADVLEAASANMGFSVAGGNFDRNGNFFLYTRDTQTGQLSPVAIASPEMQFRTLHRAKMGMDYQREIYGNMSRRFTPDQLTRRGMSNPDAPESTGGVTMSGGTARRLFGMGGSERRGISTFSADGKGGFSRMKTEADGTVTREDFGTRDQGYKGRWKQISVGPDLDDKKYDENGNEIYNFKPRQIRRYENDKTGEVISVRDGETPPWERSSLSEKERVAKANNDARLERDRTNNEARLELQGEKAKVAKANNDARMDATRYKVDAMERIAAIRAGAKGGDGSVSSVSGARGLVYKGKDLKDVASILANPLADDETKAEARRVLNSIADAMGGTGGEEPLPARRRGRTSSGGGTQKKVSYTDLKTGQTFVATGKDGKRHTFKKTEKGYERID